MTATRYTRTAIAMKTWKTNGVLLTNGHIHDVVGQISPSYVLVVMVVVHMVIVCGCHCRTPTNLTWHIVLRL